MTTRRPLTAQIKPATRNAIMDQLALAASEIERLRESQPKLLDYWVVPIGVLIGWMLGWLL